MKIDNKLETARLIAESLTWERVSRWECKHLKVGDGLSLREAIAILETKAKKIHWEATFYPVAFVLLPISSVMSILLFRLFTGNTISMGAAAFIGIASIVIWIAIALWFSAKYKVPSAKIEAAYTVVATFLDHADGLNSLALQEVDLTLRRAVCEPVEARKYLATLALYLQTDQQRFDEAKKEPGRNVERMRQAVSSLDYREAQFASALKSHVDSFEILNVTREEIFRDVERAQEAFKLSKGG